MGGSRWGGGGVERQATPPPGSGERGGGTVETTKTFKTFIYYSRSFTSALTKKNTSEPGFANSDPDSSQT